MGAKMISIALKINGESYDVSVKPNETLLDVNPNPTEPEIKEAISGNLCRCTGYVKIVNAISSVFNHSTVHEGEKYD